MTKEELAQDIIEILDQHVGEYVPTIPYAVEKVADTSGFIFYERSDLLLREIKADDQVQYSPVFVGRNIQYVHQLQNLYFAITGTELTVN